MSIPTKDIKPDISASTTGAELLATLEMQKKIQKETYDNIVSQSENPDIGKGFLAIIAAFIDFLQGDQTDITANTSISNLFRSFGFNDDDMDFVRTTGQNLRNGQTNIFEAARSTFARIRDPETALSSDQARAAIEARSSETAASVHMFLEDRRELVIQTIPLACEATGVHKDTMRAIWGVESDFGKTLLSPTKCKGDWQFSGIWNSIMSRYGDKIADLVEENHGETALADRIRNSNDISGALNDLKYDPVVSTYAASFLMMDDAQVIGVDPSKIESRDAIYSAYNISSQDAKKLYKMAENGDTRSAQGVIGSNARNNPLYFRGDVSAATALNNMNTELNHHMARYETECGNIELALKQKATTLLAQNNPAGPTERQQHYNETGAINNTGAAIARAKIECDMKEQPATTIAAATPEQQSPEQGATTGQPSENIGLTQTS